MSRDFGVPLADEKTCLPSTTMEFLGIEIDTCMMEFRLPEVKLKKLKWLIMRVLKKKVRLKEMQSLLGILAFACRIMPVGRIFSRRLYLAISGMKSPLDHIRLTTPLKEDLMVWAIFLECYNGRSFFQSEFVIASDFRLFTDAAVYIGAVQFGLRCGFRQVSPVTLCC